MPHTPQPLKHFFNFLLIALLLALCNTAKSQEKNDTTQTEEVVVNAYPDKRKLLDSPLSAYVIDKKQLQNQPSFTMVPALNTVAGVRMEERSPGSYRLSIRGSLLRSPFGVRNVKIYMDEFPLTDAGGNTYLQSIDPGSFSKLEILKGPQGSLFGANTGGVVLINPFPKRGDSALANASITGGSYGLIHEKASVQKRFKNYQFSVYEAYQKSNGYRQQSALDRKYIQATQRWDYHKNLALKSLFFYSDMNYQTPGGITLAQFNSDPQLARQTTSKSPGAAEQHAGVINKTVYGGIAHEANITSRLRHVIAVFATHTSFTNPAIANYELRNENTIGTRTYLEWSGKNEGEVSWKWNLGTEWQKTYSSITDYGNNRGTADTVQDSDNLNARQNFIFTQYSATIRKRFIVEAGLSLNSYKYNYQSLYPVYESTFSNRQFNPQFMPRLATTYKLKENLAWRASISRGYSQPTIAELLPSGTALNTNLQPEYGWNYETGLRYQNNRISIDVAGFYYRLQKAIVQRENANGASYYVNSGGTNQAGAELQLSIYLIKPRTDGIVKSLEFKNAFTYYHFYFYNYYLNNVNYSGNRVTGAPQTTVVSSLSAQFAKGFYGYVQHNYTSNIPLNDAGTAYANPYNLIQLKAGWKPKNLKRLNLEFFVGVDNLLNEKYSLGNDLNAVNGLYYNAAPARNYYFGTGFTF